MGWQSCQPYDAINLIAINRHVFASLLIKRLKNGLCAVYGFRLARNGDTVPPANQTCPRPLLQPDEMTVMISEDFLEAVIVLKAQGCRAVSFLTGRKGSSGRTTQMAVPSCSWR